MEKLSNPETLTTFKRCQLCGFESNDICEFNQFIECDEDDKPTQQILIVCKENKSCRKIIEDHPRLYELMEWGVGQPGQLMLLCGDCPFRKNSDCSHTNLKKNGGEGLLVHFQGTPFSSMMVSYHSDDGMMKCWQPKKPAIFCEGKPK